MMNLLVLATEGGVPPDHIAADLAIPLAIVIFCGAMYLLLWSNYGAKKGAWIYTTAFFGFTMMLGIFWWFGAPGTPVSTGLQNFPGQASDAYQGRWHEFEAGSALSEEFFPDQTAEQTLSAFQTSPEFRGGTTIAEFDGDPAFSALQGDLSSGSAQMLDLALRVEDGRVGLGGQARATYQEAADALLADLPGGASAYEPAEPFYTAIVDEEAGDQVLVTEAKTVRLIAANVTTQVNYTGPDGLVTLPVNEEIFYAFKDPGALWWPSAVWTFFSLALFLFSLFMLDRIEQREKEALEEISAPERLAVPIAQ